MWVDKLKAAQVLSSLNTDTPTHNGTRTLTNTRAGTRLK